MMSKNSCICVTSQLVLLVYCVLLVAVNGFSIKLPTKLFVNIVVKDPSDELSSEFSARLGLKRRFKRLIKKPTSANINAVDPNPKAAQLVSTLTKQVPYRLATNGIASDMKLDFQEGPFVVMSLEVRHVDDATMAEAKTAKSVGFQLQRLLKLIGAKDQRKLDEYVVNKLIKHKMPTITTDLSKEAGLQTETLIRAEDKQQSYYDFKLNELRSLATKLENDKE